jgi:AcrR family transcriptional regulator
MRIREQVLGAAMNAYWRDSRVAVSVNAICALADVFKPSLYRDFGIKDGLTKPVLEHQAQTVLELLEALLSSPQALAGPAEKTQPEKGCVFEWWWGTEPSPRPYPDSDRQA